MARTVGRCKAMLVGVLSKYTCLLVDALACVNYGGKFVMVCGLVIKTGGRLTKPYNMFGNSVVYVGSVVLDLELPDPAKRW